MPKQAHMARVISHSPRPHFNLVAKEPEHHGLLQGKSKASESSFFFLTLLNTYRDFVVLPVHAGIMHAKSKDNL